MEKLTITIFDHDKVYLEMFANYIRSTPYAEQFIVKSFTQSVSLDLYLNKHERIHILLVPRDFIPAQTSLDDVECVMVVDEFHPLSGKEEPFLFLQKYQPLNQLITNMLAKYREQSIRPLRLTKERHSKVISLYSSVGGCGKTTIAVNLAQQLALQDKKVFYLNLELFNCSALMFARQGQQDFAQLLYVLKTNERQLNAKLESFIRHDPVMKFDYFEPAHHVKEMLEMTVQDVMLLTERLVLLSCYDAIIIDLESTWHERIIGALQASEHILWMLTDDIQCVHKTLQLQAELQRLLKVERIAAGETYDRVLPKIDFIINKYTGTLSDNFKERGVHISGYLPYVPQWKTVERLEQLYSDYEFNDQVLKQYVELIEVS